MHEILEEFVRLARTSPHINQASGVSVRASIANAENLVSSAERRGIVHSEKHVVARVDDLAFVNASSRGKIELMLAEGDTAEDKLITSLVGEAVKNVFNRYGDLDSPEVDQLTQQFKGGLSLQVGDEVAAKTLVENYGHVKGLRGVIGRLGDKMQIDTQDEQSAASVGEFLLESLYVNNRLSKVALRGKTFFRR
jgi:magnesium chelatase subunit I